MGKAIFFAENQETAKKYIKGSGRVIKVKLKMINPLVVDDNFIYDDFLKDVVVSDKIPEVIKGNSAIARKMTWINFTSQEDKANYTKSKGYDGLIDLKYGQAAVFSSEQIVIQPLLNIRPKI